MFKAYESSRFKKLDRYNFLRKSSASNKAFNSFAFSISLVTRPTVNHHLVR
jgi:hypothetical protein